MASRMQSSSSKTSRSRTKEADTEKLSITSKRLSSIPTPTPLKSSLPTVSSRSITRKPIQTKTVSSTSKTSSAPSKPVPKAAERRFPLNSVPDGHENVMGIPTQNSSNSMPQQHRLRRKPSLRDQRSAYALSGTSVASHGNSGSESSKQAFEDARSAEILKSSPPRNVLSPTEVSTTVAPELATSQSRMQSFITHGPQPPQLVKTPELKPPAPGFIRSHSASTGLSESPSPFSNYSRGSTPTSISSASPALSQIPKFPTRRPSSPTRTHPPITRHKAGEALRKENLIGNEALSSVRETSTTRSTASPAANSETSVEGKTVTKKKVLRKSPPNPPQRVSSKTAIPSTSIDNTISQKDPKSFSRLVQPTSTTREIGTSKSATSKTVSSKIPPPRPSREGTPNLEGFGRSPIMQSNLVQHQTTVFKAPEVSRNTRLSMEDNVLDTEAQSYRPAPVSIPTPKQTVAQTATTRPSVTSPNLVSRDTSTTKEPSTGRSFMSSRHSSREPSPSTTSPSKTLSRFGLFSRKLKSSSETALPQLGEKSSRKGPAAGTGHEGYGKYGRRGRSSSTSTAASRARSTSIESNAFGATRASSSRKSSFNSNDGRPQLDDFLKDRLEPVVIGGGGQIRENRNSNTGLSIGTSNQGSTLTVDSVEQPRVLYRQDEKANCSSTSMASSFDSTNSGLSSSGPPTLAHRRSLLRTRLSEKESGMKLPTPINTNGMTASPGPETYDSTLSTAPPTDASGPLTDFSEMQEGNWLRPKKKALGTPKRTRKWNIFHRRQRSNDSLQEPTLSRQSSNEQHALGISSLQDNQPVPHYALSEDFESDHAENMEQTLRNIEDNLDLDADEYISENEAVPIREPSMLLPSPPKFPSHFETLTTLGAEIRAPLDLTNVALNRKPRLQQIGRIPRIASKRDRVHRPSPQSFSRPFARPADSEDYMGTGFMPQSHDAGSRPKLGLQTGSFSGLPFEKSTSAPPTNGMLYNLDGEHEFLHFSPRKWSEVSTANSSGTMSLAAITALISPPDAILSDDEVWGEFDDFLDHVTSPVSASPCTPGLRAPGDYFTLTGKDIKPELRASPSNSTTTIDTSGSGDDDNLDSVNPPKPRFMTSSEYQSKTDSNLSLTDLYANYGGRSSLTKSIARDSTLSTVSESQYSSQTQRSRSGSQSSITSGQAKRVTQVMAEKTRCTSTESLRFSALMTSRWLSFDRVLFSPIQDKMRSTRQDRILVVDGLGNDDWSTYCALTFPDATVHSLASMSSRPSQDQRNAENWTPPTNHRRHTYTDVNAPFPFVKNWFSAVVFRFPAANTSMAFRHAISECERVLRPGGYLELSVLDMDMVNMGSRTSHAIRSLKMDMHESRPEISLSPVSDEILKLLGKKEFENVSRAIVGVPVVGSDSGSPVKPRSHLSLGDMLADQVQGQKLYYPSTRAMAKAARWWWSKCYENVVRGQKTSIWHDEELLQECEGRETGLKLFVCYAQKPVNPPRRAMSV